MTRDTAGSLLTVLTGSLAGMTTEEPQVSNAYEPPVNAEPPPANPADFPPQLQEALRRMSQRGPIVDMAPGQTVAKDGQPITDALDEALVACNECARAVALGWWGAISRHIGPADKPVCVLCGEGEAVHTASDWFTTTAKLIEQRNREGQRRTWSEDAHIGLGIRPL